MASQALLPPSLLWCVPSLLSRDVFSVFFAGRLALNCAYTRYDRHFLSSISCTKKGPLGGLGLAKPTVALEGDWVQTLIVILCGTSVRFVLIAIMVGGRGGSSGNGRCGCKHEFRRTDGSY